VVNYSAELIFFHAEISLREKFKLSHGMRKEKLMHATLKLMRSEMRRCRGINRLLCKINFNDFLKFKNMKTFKNSPNNQREDIVVGIGAVVSVVEQERVLLLVHKQRWSSSARARDDADIGAVPESFGRSASNGLRSIRALAPHVARKVGPLDHALRARHTGRQPDFVAKHLLLLRLGRNFEANVATVDDQQREPIEALLVGLLSSVVVGAQIHLEATQMIRRQLDLDLDFLHTKKHTRCSSAP
jgi:hypothetical protein